MGEERDLIAALKPGERIAHYRVEDFLGAGSMGVAYRALNLNIGRTCVLKFLAGPHARNKALIERFAVEARAAGKLHHPNIVQVYHVGSEKGRAFIEMEYVPGRTLKQQLIDIGPMEPLPATEIMLTVTEAVRVAHDEGIAHRDLKPANIMITPDDTVKVMDFGLARDMSQAAEQARPGRPVGTPLYMPPEVFDGSGHDLRCDIYSLGVTFYLMLTGRYPLRGSNLQEMVTLRRSRTPDPPHTLVDTIPLGVSYVVLRMLAPRPEDRYSDAQSLLNELKALHAFLKAEVGLVADCRLLAVAADGRCTSHALGRTLCTVGRAPGNGVRIEDPRMSARHFRISTRARELVIEDLQSRNGTRLNGREVQREALRHGDLIQAGGTLFLVQGIGPGRGTRQGASIGGARLEPAEGKGDAIPIGRAGLVLGRAAAADVPLADPDVSEYHAHVCLDGDRLLVHDLSGGETRVNGHRVRRKHMDSGETLSVAGTDLRFVLGRGRVAPKPAPEEQAAADQPSAARLDMPETADLSSPLAEAEAPEGVPCLVVRSVAERGRRITVTEKPQIIGKGRDADIRLNDRYAADRHVLVSLVDKGIEIVDLGTGDGMAVNGKVGDRSVLTPGDVVQIGGTRLEVH